MRRISGRVQWMWVVAATCLATAMSASAQVIEWDISTDGSFHEPTNWNPQDAPDTEDESARFNVDDEMTISFDDGSSTIIDDLVINLGELVFISVGGMNGATLNVDDDAIINGGDLTLQRQSTDADVNLVIADELLVAGGNQLTIRDTAQVQADNIRLAPPSMGAGDGTVLVEGMGSALHVVGITANDLGLFSQTGHVIVQDQATADFNAALRLAFSSVVGTTAILDVLSGGQVTLADDLSVGNGFATGQSATLTVSGEASSLTQSGDTDIRIGRDVAGNVATVVVDNDGTFTTGTGQVTINETGVVTIGSASTNGTFNANADVRINGGSLTTHDADQFVLAEGKSILIQNGGVMDLADGFDAVNMSITVAGEDSQWLVDGDLNVGLGANGFLTISAGGHVSNDAATIGMGSDSNGDGLVTGESSHWEVDGSLRVGVDGTGTLDIDDGGLITSTTGVIGEAADSQGVVVVNAPDSQWQIGGGLQVGDAGAGTLVVQAGGMVSNTDAVIGNSAGGQGTAVVTGEDSTWTINGNLTVGNDGNAALTVSDSGEVEANNITVGATGNILGDGTITGPVQNGGAVFPGTSTGVLNIDGDYTQSSEGELIVELVTDEDFDLLMVTGEADLSGVLRIDAAAEALMVDDMFTEFTVLDAAGGVTGQFDLIAFEQATGLAVQTEYGANDVTITFAETAPQSYQGGGLWSALGTTSVDDVTVTADGVDAVYTVDGQFTIAGLTIGDEGPGPITSVVLDAPNRLSALNGVTVLATGVLTSTQGPGMGGTLYAPFVDVLGGELSGSLTIHSDVSFTGGTISPGLSAGTLNVEGDLILGGTTITLIELAGDMPGTQFDQITVTGGVLLDGDLGVTFIDGFVPDIGDMFQIITADGGVFGSFDAVTANHVLLDVIPGSNAVTLEVIDYLLPGDFNFDGEIDLDDYNILSSNMYTSDMSYGDGDVNGDGMVDFEDFVFLALHFGESAAETPPTSIPEPASGLLILAGVWALRRRVTIGRGGR